jgi:hypothetical protein
MHVWKQCLALVATAAALQACYKYVPVETPAAVPTGSEVRAELTDSGVVAVASQVGPSVFRIDGRLVSKTDQSLVLAVGAVTSRRTDIEQLWNGERVTIPESAIGSLQARKISASRTALTAGGLLAAVVGLYVAFDPNGIFGGGGGKGPPGRQ